MSVLLGEVEEADYEDDSTLTPRSHPLHYLTYTSIAIPPQPVP